MKSSGLYGPGTSAFSINLDELLPLTKYYIRAFVTGVSGSTFYSNELNFTTASVSVGSIAHEGIVFYVDNTGHHGLIAATADNWQEQDAWTPVTYTVTSATSPSDGQFNTGTIVIQLGVSKDYAAEKCFFYFYDQLRGSHDWFYRRRTSSPSCSTIKMLLGGFSATPYWSSTEFDSTRAWSLDFSNGVLVAADKLTPYGVRAIRTF